MKTLSTASLSPSSIAALVLTVLLTACGGQHDFQEQFPASAIAAQSQASSGAATGATPEPAPVVIAATSAVPTVVASNMPAPDCAAEGCAGLRIIDGNAEAWRIDAARRAALEAHL